jgi:acyl-CoA thioesterase-1
MKRNCAANAASSFVQMAKPLRIILVSVVALALAAVGRADERRTILFYGDSLTAGYGLDDPTQTAYPARIQEKIDEAGLPYRVVNAGLSGETSAGGVRRIEWVLRQPVDVCVLELGANDGLRGLPLDVLQENLQQILDRVKARNPATRLIIAGMRMPVSMGEYAARFDALYAPLAAANEATLVPFLLRDVGAVPELNLPDGMHPNPAGHAIVARNVWEVLEPLLTQS